MQDHQSQIDFFNERAANWDEISPPPSNKRLEEIVQLIGTEDLSSIVDIGSGTGVLIPHLLKKINNKGKIYAVDPAKEMLSVLRKKFTDPRIETKVETLENCTLEDNNISAIICFSCFPHISDKEKAIQNAYRMLKKNGRFIIAHVSSRHEMNEFHAKCDHPVKHDLIPKKDIMYKLISHAHLQIIHFKDEPGRYEVIAIK